LKERSYFNNFLLLFLEEGRYQGKVKERQATALEQYLGELEGRSPSQKYFPFPLSRGRG
jgi:hypothetical protein